MVLKNLKTFRKIFQNFGNDPKGKNRFVKKIISYKNSRNFEESSKMLKISQKCSGIPTFVVTTGRKELMVYMKKWWKRRRKKLTSQAKGKPKVWLAKLPILSWSWPSCGRRKCTLTFETKFLVFWISCSGESLNSDCLSDMCSSIIPSSDGEA